MGHLQWSHRDAVPRRADGRRVLVAAFAGWNDAGDAATGAVEHLWGAWGARTVAAIDPEEFHDFTESRPTVRLDADGVRHVDWPAHELGWAHPAGTDGVALWRAVEPQLRWRSYAEELTAVATELECDLVVLVGALLADVPHTRPTPVIGTVLDDALMASLGLQRSSYEGPTGIVGVLQDHCHRSGLDTASLWAAVPAYVPAAPSPAAALALVRRLATLVGAAVDTTVLEAAAISAERQMSDLVADDDETAEYVARLEADHDAEAALDRAPLDDASLDDADSLVDEVERYLRDR